MTRTPLVIATCVALSAATSAQSFRKNQPPRIAVEARATPAISKTPQTLELVLTTTPMPGMHVYAPGNPDYIAVTVTVSPVAGITAGAPVFPDGETYFFAPLKQSVKVYSKPFVVKVPLKVVAAFARTHAAADRVELKGQVDYQACDDKVCFPPQAMPFSTEVPVTLSRR